jgi:hypothetical protein
MTIKELKEKISALDDDMMVGGSGHFGEFLEVFSVDVEEVYPIFLKSGNGKKETILCIRIEYAGEEPD